ncbi:IS256 family transposase [Anaerocellum danielii]|uniref:Mutator family transposase n=1 Tax=Anaerocellum danielii TaxID=1387557 RepID=A0ABZ0U3R0_9FIRM|nr:IS256 family transposase [Caldicellulosiruptor danielii]WPX09238.1 IS256 family transposase [Caldicellulosiruptor danielii]WPX09457.1 IS256 family transposase [Caldicellulosiruptor danielii]
MEKDIIFETVKNMAIEQVLNTYCSQDDPNRPALKQLLEHLLNCIMLSERKIYLDKNQNDKGNGFYDRMLSTPVGNLELSVPRTRTSNFRPSVLPEPYKRVDSSYTDLLMSLVANGYSESLLIQTLKSLNLPYSEEEITKIKNDLKNELQLFKQRELPENAFALIIDGYHCEIRDNSKVKQATCYVVLGIDLEGKKDIFGIYTFFGKENKADWMKVFEDLITRGLKKVLIIVSDDFPGIIDAVKIAYPYADHQLCFVHLQRNVKRHMTKEDSSKFNKELERVRLSSSDIDEAVSAFNQLCNEYLPKYPRFLKGLLDKAEYYFAHIKYPEEIRKHIYTTNAVESINSIIEKIRIKSGGYFQSTEILEINIYLQRENFKRGKWKNGVPLIKHHTYEILQLFNLRYELDTQNS